ncbi:conserved hypothetical protein [uncultured Gammaproteobacteria bacterium]
MLADKYYQFKKSLDEQGVMFTYSGVVSETILFGLGDTVKQKMHVDEADSTTIKRVFSVFVEQVQNIIRYSAEKASGERKDGREMCSGVISVGRNQGQFFVVGGNLVHNRDLPRLRNRLEHLRSLDKDELKAYYKQKLREDSEETSKGASIGLIEIARRAAGPIMFDFKVVNDNYTFFCLKAFV